MIEVARRLNPGMAFRTGNMLALDHSDRSLHAITAFYAIVNLRKESIEKAFREMHRVLQPEGLLLLAFHVGNEILHEEEQWDLKISMDFYLLNTKEMTDLLEKTGFNIEQAIEREPYPEVEYPSRRAYILAQKPV
jgi:ubiquinone/menaquinone biosynthesis C-methylase UbiE